MPFRLAAILLAIALLTGCAEPTETYDSDAEEAASPMEESASADGTAEPDGDAAVAGGLDGAWRIVLTPMEEGETIRGTWRIEERGDNRFVDLAGGALIDVADRSVTGDAFSMSGTANTADGPLPFDASGTLSGNAMEGEVRLEGMGAYALVGTRRAE